MKIIFDSNILISALIARGCPHDVLGAAIDHATIITSPYILNEVETKLLNKLHFPSVQVREASAFLQKVTTCVSPSGSTQVSFRDAKDIPVLQLALASKAQFLITGDKALLEKKAIGKTKIITAREAVKYL